MLNLLIAEKIKVVKSRKMWVVLGLMTLLAIYLPVNDYLMHVNYDKVMNLRIDTVVNGATAIMIAKKANGFIVLIFGAVISLYIGEEFQNGTIRNALSLGRSRNKYYFSKLIMAEIITILSVLLLTTIGVLVYTWCFGFGEIEGFTNIGEFWLKIFATELLLITGATATGVALSFMVRNTSLALITTFLYTMGAGFLPWSFIRFESLRFLPDCFVQKWLFYTDFAAADIYNQIPQMIVVSLATIVVSSAIGMFVFQKSDIK